MSELKLIYNKYPAMKHPETNSQTVILPTLQSFYLQFKSLLKAPVDEITFQVTDGVQ